MRLPQHNLLRRLFRFRLSSLLVLIFLFSCFLMWVGDDLLRQRIQRPIIAKIEQAGGTVLFEHQVNGSSMDAAPPGSAFTRWIFGDDIFATVNLVAFHEGGSDEDLKDLHQLSELQSVVLRGPETTDNCIEELLRIRGLSGLQLAGTSISPEGFARLASLPVRNLTVNGFTDDYAVALPAFTKLEWLQLVRSKTTDRAMQSVGQLLNLRGIDIWRCNSITDSGIAELAGLTELESLSLLYCPITDDSVETISKFHQLRMLRLNGAITGAQFHHLNTLNKLERLDLIDTQVDDRAMEIIGQFKNLNRLELHGTAISDAGLSELAGLDKLTFLDIKATFVTDKGLIELAKLKSLQTLCLEQGNGITDAGIDALKAKLPNCRIDVYTMQSNGRGYRSKSL